MTSGEKLPMPTNMIFGKINHLDNKQPAGITPAGFIFPTFDFSTRLSLRTFRVASRKVFYKNIWNLSTFFIPLQRKPH